MGLCLVSYSKLQSIYGEKYSGLNKHTWKNYIPDEYRKCVIYGVNDDNIYLLIKCNKCGASWNSKPYDDWTYTCLECNKKANQRRNTININKCGKCGKLWHVDKLDYNGICPYCLKAEPQKEKTTVPAHSPAAPVTKMVKCKKCGVERPAGKLNKDGLCPICSYKEDHILQCDTCGKLWHIDKLDSNGICPDCIKGKHKKREKVTEAGSDTNFASRDTGHPLVSEFLANDFSWMYDEKEDMIMPVIDAAVLCNDAEMIIKTGVVTKNDYLVGVPKGKDDATGIIVGEIKSGKGGIIINQLLYKNKMKNPVMCKFISNLKEYAENK